KSVWKRPDSKTLEGSEIALADNLWPVPYEYPVEAFSDDESRREYTTRTPAARPLWFETKLSNSELSSVVNGNLARPTPRENDASPKTVASMLDALSSTRSIPNSSLAERFIRGILFSTAISSTEIGSVNGTENPSNWATFVHARSSVEGVNPARKRVFVSRSYCRPTRGISDESPLAPAKVE